MTAVFLAGVLATSYLVAGLFFLRFWRKTGDRLFAYFAAAFALLAVQRTMLPFVGSDTTLYVLLYAVRALAFLGLAAGILDKNRRR